MPRTRRLNGGELNPWPGYVDALSTLLMVIIFVLLVFVLSQAFLSVTLSGQDRALQRLGRQVSELGDLLSLEKGRAKDLQTTVTQLTQQLSSANTARDHLTRDLDAARGLAAQEAGARDRLQAERDQLAARLSDAAAQAQAAAARYQQVQTRLAQANGAQDQASQAAAVTAAQLAEAQKQLAELNKTVTADRATIQARLGDLARLGEQVRNLTALRDELEKQAQDAAVHATTEAQRRAATDAELADEKQFADSARAQIAALTQQVEQVRAQMQQVGTALDASEKAAKDKDVQIANLGSRLNAALASKVEELQRYRSEFFGKLREVLQGRPGIQVVGDRFVFQSEVLFPTGSADLSDSGKDQIRDLAKTLKGIIPEIPSDVNWLLRVDGHADRLPLSGGQFASNWELSAQRAINVVKLLVTEGIPPERLAATGFGEFQPLDTSDTPQGYARNRRIELRLTDR
jgi:chemotaxis protein MotB